MFYCNKKNITDRWSIFRHAMFDDTEGYIQNPGRARQIPETEGASRKLPEDWSIQRQGQFLTCSVGVKVSI